MLLLFLFIFSGCGGYTRLGQSHTPEPSRRPDIWRSEPPPIIIREEKIPIKGQIIVGFIRGVTDSQAKKFLTEHIPYSFGRYPSYRKDCWTAIVHVPKGQEQKWVKT